MAPNKLIIDTDPGTDDTWAMLLALTADSAVLQLALISVTYGNVPLLECLRNVASLFHSVHQEVEWRKQKGLPVGFAGLQNPPPLVAVGPDGPLEDQLMVYDFFHGSDGLSGIHDSHPHLSPSDSWRALFGLPATQAATANNQSTAEAPPDPSHSLFRASTQPAHREILRILREEPDNTVTIIAVGPLTNLALAAHEDPNTLLRAKEVIVMGGAINVPGNVGPLAEFNTHADSIAAARLYALTSPDPASTMPRPKTLTPPLHQTNVQASESHPKEPLGEYPPNLSRKLNLTLFPLDLTEQHEMLPSDFASHVDPLIAAGSPLATWVSAFTLPAINKSISHGNAGLVTHDAICVWYFMCRSQSGWEVKPDVDLRVETAGMWTNGACVTDRRGRKKIVNADNVTGDANGWLTTKKGNHLNVCEKSPGRDAYLGELFGQIFAHLPK